MEELQTDLVTQSTHKEGLQTDLVTQSTHKEGVQTDLVTQSTHKEGLQTDLVTQSTHKEYSSGKSVAPGADGECRSNSTPTLNTKQLELMESAGLILLQL